MHDHTNTLLFILEGAIGLTGACVALAVFVVLWLQRRRPYFIALILAPVCDLVSVGLLRLAMQPWAIKHPINFGYASSIFWMIGGLCGIVGFGWWLSDLLKKNNEQGAQT